jgi:hypothetical protein
MKNIPETQRPIVLRTDFSNERAWQEVCVAIKEPAGQFRAYVTFVSDPAFEGITIEEVVEQRARKNNFILFIADDRTISHAEHPILVVDLWHEPGQTFRVILSEMWCAENNLSQANMDWRDFADNVDANGIFRGFDGQDLFPGDASQLNDFGEHPIENDAL